MFPLSGHILRYDFNRKMKNAPNASMSLCFYSLSVNDNTKHKCEIQY